MPALPHSITISDEECTYLRSLIKTRTIQAQFVDRARMLLYLTIIQQRKTVMSAGIMSTYGLERYHFFPDKNLSLF